MNNEEFPAAPAAANFIQFEMCNHMMQRIMPPCASRTASRLRGSGSLFVGEQGVSPLPIAMSPLRGSYIRRARCAEFTHTRGVFAPRAQESRRDGIE